MRAIDRSKLPPGPKTIHPLGHLFPYRRDSIGFLKKIAATYGDIVHFKLGNIRVVLLNHPEHIKEVLTNQHKKFVKGRPLEMAKELLGEGLLTSEGEYHKRHSRLIQPAFHRSMIDSYVPATVNCISETMANWESGMQVDMKDEMTRMSIAIAGRVLFNSDIINETREISEALDAATNLFGRISMPFSEWLLKLPLPGSLKFQKAKSRIDATVLRMIAERRKNKLDNGDLISLFLRTQNGDIPGEGWSDREIRDESVTLFLTAFDTTSTALTWTWYLLSQHPESEAILHAEIDSVLGGRVPHAGDIPHLKYTRMVFGESLRLYPPSYVIPRQAVEDFPVDRYVVPRGSIILMSPYLIQRDPRFYAHPEKFDPYAWEKHSHGQHSKYEYFPFSRGPRSCIGEPLAWVQGVLTLATIVQNWRISLVPGHRVELLPQINLRPKYGMRMILQRRHDGKHT